MADKNHPRRGSLAYKPQRRAARLYPQLTPPEETEDGELVGFAGYKAGMTRVLRIDDEQDSATKGQEVADPVTVIEVPPLTVYGVRAYEEAGSGMQPLTDVVADSVSDAVQRRAPVQGGASLDDIADDDAVADVRLLVHTRPQESGLGKKTPELFEMPIGGDDIDTKQDRAEELLGEDIAVDDVIEAGQYVDVISVTKGKGFEGPVKRHGVKTLGRKTQKSDRKAGNIGPWHPDHTSWKVPQPGGTGTNQRTELNKRVLAIEDADAVNPEGGFSGYGEVDARAVLVKGSVPGPEKRLVMFRPAVRKQHYPTDPDITHIRT